MCKIFWERWFGSTSLGAIPENSTSLDQLKLIHNVQVVVLTALDCLDSLEAINLDLCSSHSTRDTNIEDVCAFWILLQNVLVKGIMSLFSNEIFCTLDIWSSIVCFPLINLLIKLHHVEESVESMMKEHDFAYCRNESVSQFRHLIPSCILSVKNGNIRLETRQKLFEWIETALEFQTKSSTLLIDGLSSYTGLFTCLWMQEFRDAEKISFIDRNSNSFNALVLTGLKPIALSTLIQLMYAWCKVSMEDSDSEVKQRSTLSDQLNLGEEAPHRTRKKRRKVEESTPMDELVFILSREFHRFAETSVNILLEQDECLFLALNKLIDIFNVCEEFASTEYQYLNRNGVLQFMAGLNIFLHHFWGVTL